MTEQKQQKIFIKKQQSTTVIKEANFRKESRDSGVEDAYRKVFPLFKIGNIYKYRQILNIVNTVYHNKTSIIPSDYCYNRINLDIVDEFERRMHIFEYVSKGIYKFIGENASFSGCIEHKDKIVGRWENGKILYLDKNLVI